LLKGQGMRCHYVSRLIICRVLVSLIRCILRHRKCPPSIPPPAPSQAHLRLSDSRSSCSCPDRGPSRTRRCMYHANGRSRRASYSIRHDHIHDTPSSVHSFSEHSRFDREGGDHTLMYNLAPDLEMYPGSIDPSSDYAKTESPRRSPSASFFSSQWARLIQFFRDLYNLPWVAQRITVDYIPKGRSSALDSRPTTWYHD